MSIESRHGKSWEVFDGTSSEVEMGVLLHGLVRMLKPGLVVETGCYHGHATFALASACAANGHGRVISCEINEEYVRIARNRCGALPVEVRHGNTCGGLPELAEADFAFLDSDYATRPSEFRQLKPGCVAVVHDTDQYDSELGEFVRQNGGLTFKAGRGFGIAIKQ